MTTSGSPSSTPAAAPPGAPRATSIARSPDQQDAVRLRPGSAILYFNRAVTYLAQNDSDHALADFGQVIQLAPDFAVAYRSRGDLFYARNDFAGAIKEYDAALRLNARDFRALAMRGLAKWQLRDRDGGKADLRDAMRINSAVTVALVGQAHPVKPGDAAAPSAAPVIWDFRGSQVALTSDGDVRRIQYDLPRAELALSGVAEGTVLFEGREENNRYAGKAFVFSRKCGGRGYDVTGAIEQGPSQVTLTLAGDRPELDKDCHPTDKVRHDVLTFSRPAP